MPSEPLQPVVPPVSSPLSREGEILAPPFKKERAHTAIDADLPTTALGWGLFWRSITAQAGVLFLVAGFICFFAFNWAALPAFAKFGLIAAMMLGCLALPLTRGVDSSVGNLGLLACGLLAGPLMAVFGQTYQTGADAWELFRAWALFLVPLALIGRQTGLWFALWLVGSLWWGLFFIQSSPSWGRHPVLFYPEFIVGQTLFALLWEAISNFAAGPGRSFLYTRWFPRLQAGFTFLMLTFAICSLIIEPYYLEEAPSTLYYALYAACLALGTWWYGKKQPDTLMVALGLLSLIAFALTALFSQREMWSLGGAIFGTIVTLAGAAGAERILRGHYKGTRDAANKRLELRDEAAKEERRLTLNRENRQAREKKLPPLSDRQALFFALSGHTYLPSAAPAEASPASPWYARFLVGLCAWIALPMLLAILGLLFYEIFRFRDAEPFIVGSLLFLGVGAALSRRPGIFAQQFALGLALAGTIGGGFAPVLAWRMESAFFLPAVVMCTLGFLIVQNTLYRFLAACGGLFMLSLQVALFVSGRDSIHRLENTDLFANAVPNLPMDGFGILLFIPFVIAVAAYAAVGIMLVEATLRSSRQEQDKPVWFYPLSHGCLAALLCTAAVDLPLVPTFIFFTPYFPPTLYMVGVGAGIALMYFVQRLLRSLGTDKTASFCLMVLPAAVAVLSFRHPWIGAGFLTLALARQRSSLPLLGAGITFLAVCINLEYYNLNTSLLSKSLHLGATGLVLVGAACGIHYYLASAVRRGRLPVLFVLPFGTAHSLPAGQAGIAEKTEERPTPESASANTHNLAETVQRNELTAPAGTGFRFIFSGAGLRKGVAASTMLAFLFLFTMAVHDKEQVLSEGTMLLLPLQPVDPRSLMQGDYMILQLAVENDIKAALHAESSYRETRRGLAVMKTDTSGEATFRRLHRDEPLEPGEHLLAFKEEGSTLTVGSGAFFFQEGFGKAFAQARFAEIRVDKKGTVLITHLRDAGKKRIEPHLPSQ